jgi:uncharacterized protein YecE (DUF72 family)
MIKWKVGCSGFHYREWKDFFYPEGLSQKNWLKYYCTQYNTLELNSTFYKFPTAEGMRRWYEQSCPEFVFSVKVPRLITHYKKFNDCKGLIDDFYFAIDKGLAEKVSCILYQLPASTVYSTEALEQMCSVMSSTHKNVIEFRHASWWKKSVVDFLKQRNIIFCNVSHPLLVDQLLFSSETTYIRMHGVPELYYSAYTEDSLRSLYEAVSANRLQEAYIYFNNTALSGAVENSRFLISLIQHHNKLAYDFSPGSMPEIKKSKKKAAPKAKAATKKNEAKKQVSRKAAKEKYPPVNDLG